MAKMTLSFFLAVALFAGNSMAVLPSPGTTGSCAGGHANGEDFFETNYWYRCEDGTRVNKGCVGSDNKKVEIGGTFTSGEYLLGCVNNGGYIATEYKGCVVDGSPKEAGVEFQVGDAYKTCVKEGNSVSLQTTGCVHEGRSVKLGEKVAKDGFLLQCRINSAGAATLNKAGCVVDGNEYMIGQAIIGPKVWYICTSNGPEEMGCMYNGQQMKTGDHYNDLAADVAYECVVDGPRTAFKGFACLGPENVALVDRRPGCSWINGQYEETCRDDGGGKLTKVQTACMYTASGGTTKIMPGCIQTVVTQAVGCSGNEKLTLQTYASDQIASSGLRQC